MKCNNCGVELTPGKRFCPGCGLPVADATAKPVAEEEESVVELRKRMIELKPFVAAFEKEKEEERKRKEEERIKASEAAVAASWSYKDLEELFDFDDDEEDEEFDEEESLEGLSELEEELTEEEKSEGIRIAKRLAESFLEEEKLSKKEVKIDEEDERFDSIDVVDIEEEEEKRVLNLENLYPSDVYDYMYELEGSEIRMFGYMYFMQIEDDNCIRIDLEDDDCNLSCFIDLNDNYMDKAGNLISAEELQVILKSFKNSGIMFVSGTVEVKNDDPVILVDSMENCMFGIKKLKS